MLGREAPGRMEVFKSAPALAGFLQSPGSEDALRELAERLVPINVEAGTTLATLAPALRFVVSGRLQLRRQRQLLPGDVQNLEAGSVYGLHESASQVEPEARPLLQRGRVPDDFFVLLEGSCQILRSGECIALLRGPVCIGYKQVLLQRPMAGDAVLDVSPRARTTVVRIDGGYFQRLLRKEPDFRRSVYRGNPELSPRPAPPAVHQILMLDSREELPLRHLGDRLAERLAIHLQERVLVLRVAKTGPPSARTGSGWRPWSGTGRCGCIRWTSTRW